MTRLSPPVAVLLALSGVACSTAVAARAETVPFDSERWTWHAKEYRIEEHLGRRSLYLDSGKGWIEGLEMLDGVIEFDVSFTGQRGFSGALWRFKDASSYEELYLRPHQSGNPDANQYTPVFHGRAGWQLYHGEGYGAAVDYPYDTWIPVRIVVSGRRGEVFIGDLEQPAFAIHELKREPVAGPVGVLASFAPAWFSRFRVEATASPELVSRPRPAVEAEPGTVRSWQISSTFAEAALGDGPDFPQSIAEGLRWTDIDAEASGMVNLARVQAIEGGSNTAIGRLVVTADRPCSVRLRFGYSDRISVYLGGRRLYRGDNGYRSRDYRYLGTIGLFDELTLPLGKGANELWMAVSESFGGWGLIAWLETLDGVTVSSAEP